MRVASTGRAKYELPFMIKVLCMQKLRYESMQGFENEDIYHDCKSCFALYGSDWTIEIVGLRVAVIVEMLSFFRRVLLFFLRSNR